MNIIFFTERTFQVNVILSANSEKGGRDLLILFPSTVFSAYQQIKISCLMILPFPLFHLRGKHLLDFSVAPCFPAILINLTAVMKSGQRINWNACPYNDLDTPIKSSGLL